MAETFKKVVPYSVRMKCDKEDCNGEMEPSGKIMLASEPPQFPHKCTECGVERAYYASYPYIAYREESDE